MDCSLSVIIPVFNEEKTIREVMNYVVCVNGVRQIIIVDDGSTDGTQEILQGQLPQSVEVIRNEDNYGKGWAIRKALPHVKYEIVIIQDADLESHPCQYEALVTPILKGDAEVVYGNRLSREHFIRHPFHYLGNKLLTRLFNTLNGCNISDVCTSLRVIKRSVFDSLDFSSNGFDFDIELTVEILRSGVNICSVPISYHPRTPKEGKKFCWRDRMQMLQTVLTKSSSGGIHIK